VANCIIAICAFAIYRQGHKENLRINLYKFEDLRFAGWHAQEICGFVIAERAKEFADL
jgi:hypothetical protein